MSTINKRIVVVTKVDPSTIVDVIRRGVSRVVRVERTVG